MRSGAMRKGNVISDQGTPGAQNAGRRPADRSGRNRRRASSASVSDRWRAVVRRHGCAPLGVPSRVSNAGMAIWSVRAAPASPRGLVARCRGCSNAGRRDQVHGNRWQSRFGIRHGGNALYQRHQQDTNAPNDDQFVLASASGASQSTSRIPVDLTSTPHALKLPEHKPRQEDDSNYQCWQRRGSEILLTSALRPSRPRLRRAASRLSNLERSLGRLAFGLKC